MGPFEFSASRRSLELTAQNIANASNPDYSRRVLTQGELVAFIVGAALRYQLGDESRSRPRFAPVFLDEGFVKSDSEFAGRSVRAWQDLGFQLVIAAPLDKVTALEPYMDLLLDVTKSPTGYSFVSELRDADDGGATAEGAAR